MVDIRTQIPGGAGDLSPAPPGGLVIFVAYTDQVLVYTVPWSGGPTLVLLQGARFAGIGRGVRAWALRARASNLFDFLTWSLGSQLPNVAGVNF